MMTPADVHDLDTHMPLDEAISEKSPPLVDPEPLDFAHGVDEKAIYYEILARRGATEQALFKEDIEYTKQEEQRVVRILDTRLFTAVLLSTFVLNVDRTNISNAISAGLPADLGFDINTVNSARYVKWAGG